MPTSTRRRLAALRTAYTAEHPNDSSRGIGRGKTLGFDRCTPAQRWFRAQLALHLFNTSDGPPTMMSGSAAAFLSYTIAVSPRYDSLVVFRGDAIENLAGRLLGTRTGKFGVAGLRVAAVVPFRLYHLTHLPTGARLIISDQSDFLPANVVAARTGPPGEHGPGVDVPLSVSERRDLAIAGSASPSAQRLLAGLAVRASIGDPGGRWDLKQWSVRQSRLEGAGNLWEMHWLDEPDPRSIAAALTDPLAGIPGARSIGERHGRHIDIQLDDARLRIRHAARVRSSRSHTRNLRIDLTHPRPAVEPQGS